MEGGHGNCPVESQHRLTVVFASRTAGNCHVGELRYLDFHVTESRLYQLLPLFPGLARRLQVGSAFHSNATEVRPKPSFYVNTYDYDGFASWVDTGVQELAASGWRAGEVLEAELNVAKASPPNLGKGAINIEPSELMKYVESADLQGYQHWVATCVSPRGNGGELRGAGRPRKSS